MSVRSWRSCIAWGGRPALGNLRSRLPLPTVVLGLWLVGAVTLLMRTGVGFLATRRLRRSAAPPVDAEWVRLAVDLTGQLGLTRPVRVLSSSGAAMPMTWGWWRPVVLVPTTGDWSTVRKRVVLLHELSHVARHDCVWQFVANLAVSAYWFNPLVWLAVRAQRVERERACDDAAEALGRIRSETAVDGLTASLRPAGGSAARQIIEALGRIGGDRSLEALIGVADDASPAVRHAVIEALSNQRWTSRVAPMPNPRPDAEPVVAPTSPD